MSRVAGELDRHRRALRECRRCGYAGNVAPIVSLARSPKMMLVGQAPGRVEAEGGAPFSGRAGRTLFSWFSSIGLDEPVVRSRIYIGAVTRCFPGSSPSGRGDRVPSPAERDRCAPWLASEIRIIRPRVIIPVGRLAIDVFLGPRPLDEVIGEAHPIDRRASLRSAQALDTRDVPTVVIPLPHPSGASSWIHAPGHRALLCRAMALVARHYGQLHPEARVA
jgi:uracil-DNA glycosylase